MESRVDKIGDTLASIDKRVAVIESNYATKADVANAKNSIILWVVMAIIFAQLLPALPALLRAVGWL